MVWSLIKVSEVVHQGIYPPQYGAGPQFQPQGAQYLCLDLILAFVNQMAVRAEGVGNVFIHMRCVSDHPRKIGLWSLARREYLPNQCSTVVILKQSLLDICFHSRTCPDQVAKEAGSHWGISFQCEAEDRDLFPWGEQTDLCRPSWVQAPQPRQLLEKLYPTG